LVSFLRFLVSCGPFPLGAMGFAVCVFGVSFINKGTLIYRSLNDACSDYI